MSRGRFTRRWALRASAAAIATVAMPNAAQAVGETSTLVDISPAPAPTPEPRSAGETLGTWLRARFDGELARLGAAFEHLNVKERRHLTRIIRSLATRSEPLPATPGAAVEHADREVLDWLQEMMREADEERESLRAELTGQLTGPQWVRVSRFALALARASVAENNYLALVDPGYDLRGVNVLVP